LSLQTRQVRLNSGKTKILNEVEARKHFKIRENRFLNAFELRLADKESRSVGLKHERAFLAYAIPWGLRVGCFATGNGEKILKRSIHYARLLNSSIQPNEVARMFLDWPGSRETILRWCATSDDPNSYFKVLNTLLSGGETIDDLAIVQIA